MGCAERATIRRAMLSSRVQIGIIGIGFGQQVHVPAFRRDPRCEVIAIAATSDDRARRVASLLGVPSAYGSWQELIADKRIQAVAIATSPAVQYDIAFAALRAGKSVFCEKPLAASLDAARTLAEVAKDSGKVHMVDFEFPEIDEWKLTKTLLEEGKIGPLRHVSIYWDVETYSNRAKLISWKNASEQGGGALNAFVSHVFYYCEWFFGRVGRVFCKLFRAPGDTRTADSLAVLSMETDRGIPILVNVSAH